MKYRYELLDSEDDTKVYGYLRTDLTVKEVQELINPIKDTLDINELIDLLYEFKVEFEEIKELDGVVWF